MVIIPCIVFPILFGRCKKLVDISTPVNSITAEQVFSTDAQANSALAGIYSSMINQNPFQGNGVFSNGALSIFGGLSSDELVFFYGSAYQDYWQFNTNTLQSNNAILSPIFWAPAYYNVYQANAIIEGVNTSNQIDDSAKHEFIGEAKFIRAFCYFYLTNLFGDVPLILTTDFNKITLMSRTSQSLIYKQIIQDLKDAQTLLLTDYSVGINERIRPNKWAATALLARAYVYTGDWANAEMQATSIINNSTLFGLVKNLSKIFDKNSNEAIWQLQQNSSSGSYYNSTIDGQNFIKTPNNPYYYISNQLLNAFEVGDQRYATWIQNYNYNGTVYYYPYKYIIGAFQQQSGANIPQYYTVFRLAEQYLIRAEARAQQGIDLIGAANDLDSIRIRAGLSNSTATTKDDLLAAVYHERQIEFFAEWGHRWFDLKRTKQANAILGPIKIGWNEADQLYPIPQNELLTDPNLTQNAGY